jgi:anaerobic ribonucleoside-triphosphate reductase activating protein
MSGELRRSALSVGGLTPLTTTDFPGRLACVVFVQGCPWRCTYCHNPHLLARDTPAQPSWRQVRDFLERRVGLLDAVVFSGGEPTADRALPEAMREVRALGFQVGLHTGGAYPLRLTKVLPLVDWVGMDFKADLCAYARITGAAGSGARALESAGLILDSGVDYEFRTTYHSGLLSEDELLALTGLLASLGVRNYALQAFRAQGCAAPELAAVAPQPLHEAVVASIARRFARFTFRDARASGATVR